MTRVSRLAATTIETPDLERALAHYTEIMGLEVSDRGRNSAYLRLGREPFSLVLCAGPQAATTRLAFEVATDEVLVALADTVAAAGGRAERVSDPAPGIATALRFRDPKGTAIEVYCAPDGAASSPPQRGIGPAKLGHVAFNVADHATLAETHRFYAEALGFRVSDWIGDFFVFMRCNADHHTCNFLIGKANRMHHLAFELRDWAHLQAAADWLARNGIELLWGPGRHGPGHNIFLYYRDPDGNIIELFCEVDRMIDEELGWFEPRPWHEDYPQRPKVWVAGPRSVNIWGPPPPEGFL